MRHVSISCVTYILSIGIAITAAQQPSSSTTLAPTPKAVTMAQLQDPSGLDGQLIQLNNVIVRHSDTAQVFTFGEAKGREIHVLIPSPAVDGARVGDAVTVAGRVRRYDPKAFEKDYHWFRQADYPDVHGGEFVVVATSVQTQEGTQLVPGNTISTLPPDAPKTRPAQPRP